MLSDDIDFTSELYQWQQHNITERLLKKIKTRLKECETDLCDGRLIISPALEKEYCRAIGEIEVLRDVIKLIETGEYSE